MNVTTDELFALLGIKEAELFLLRKQLGGVTAERDAAKVALATADAEVTKLRDAAERATPPPAAPAGPCSG